MKIDIKQFCIKKCEPSCITEILKIQNETLQELNDPDILRKNSQQMLADCLNPPNITIGAWYGDILAAFVVLYFPIDDAEKLSILLDDVDTNNMRAANKKLCIVRKQFRGNGLQYELSRKLEEYAKQEKVKIICTTVSPKNLPSINNILRLGYTFNKKIAKYNSQRNLYYKFLC